MSITSNSPVNSDGRSSGATVDASRIRAAIFHVVSIVHASAQYPDMHARRSTGVTGRGDAGDCTIDLVREHAEAELIQDLLLIAASLRVHNEMRQRKLFNDETPLGFLIREGEQSVLYMKDACDKIIHADDLRFGGGTKPYELNVYNRELPGPFVLQTLNMKGFDQKGRPWEIALDLGVYCEEAAKLTRDMKTARS